MDSTGSGEAIRASSGWSTIEYHNSFRKRYLDPIYGSRLVRQTYVLLIIQPLGKQRKSPWIVQGLVFMNSLRIGGSLTVIDYSQSDEDDRPIFYQVPYRYFQERKVWSP